MSRFALLGLLAPLGCGGGQPPSEPTPPATCLAPDPPGKFHGGDPSFTTRVGEIVDLPFTTYTPAGQSHPGVVRVEKLPDRLRFTSLRPGSTEAYVMKDGACLSYTFLVRGPTSR